MQGQQLRFVTVYAKLPKGAKLPPTSILQLFWERAACAARQVLSNLWIACRFSVFHESMGETLRLVKASQFHYLALGLEDPWVTIAELRKKNHHNSSNIAMGHFSPQPKPHKFHSVFRPHSKFQRQFCFPKDYEEVSGSAADKHFVNGRHFLLRIYVGADVIIIHVPHWRH